MKPIVVLNPAAQDQTTLLDAIAILQDAGYVVIFSSDPSSVVTHQAPSQRERIATAAMAGFLAEPSNAGSTAAAVASWAVAQADALIKELNQ
jgi:hypothetical protein